MAALVPGVGTPPSKERQSISSESSSRSALPLPGKGFSNEDVAVVGMACRVAGGNDTPEKLWETLMNKSVCSGEVPSWRWEPYYRRDPRNQKILKATTKKGYFIDNLQDFDNTFFGISPKEALLMDPQQRMALEATWEALEDAGIPPQNLARSNTAVFMGVNSEDYGKLVLEDLPGIEAWMGIGTAYCGIPNRVSYQLDFRGPSTAVDAACASSLVAIHHARQALLARESDVAIAGGMNALCAPSLTRVLDLAKTISKDGQCRSFDDSASGYGRGEGVGCVVLKRMSDAIRDNDNILAALKGSAVGQDGKTKGIMAPNGEAQEAIARVALADLDPKSIQYVEAHATSTLVGDPTEIRALSNIYGADRPEDAPCYAGSIKPNIGHLEAGAGVMGFIKAVLAMKKGIIPPQANLQTLNKKIDWTKAGIRVPFDSVKWPEVQGPERGAVCSYGYGGTVSHAIIEKAPDFIHDDDDEEEEEEEEAPKALLLSAPQEKRIPGAAQALADFIAGEGAKEPLSTIACTLATRRGHHDCRTAVIAGNHTEALEQISNIAEGKSSPSGASGRVLGKDLKNGAVWMVSGHGAQWSDMGKELLEKEPAFRDVIAELEPIIQDEMGFSATAALQTGNFESSDKIQVMSFSMHVAIAELLRSKGAQPSAVIGHSMGEIAAAVIAGALTLTEGAVVMCRRAVLYRQVMGKGAMAMVNSPFETVNDDLRGRSNICAAIDSSPYSCVVSGSIKAIEDYTKLMQQSGIKVSQVNADISFHSPVLDSLAEQLHKALSGAISPRQPSVPLYSTSSPSPKDQDLRDADYWVRNMVKPVHLTSAIRAAAEDGYRVFLEVSSHPVILHSANETLMEMELEDVATIPTLVRKHSPRRTVLQSIASMWCKGTPIDWSKQFVDVNWSKGVPATIWRHEKFWREVGTGGADTSTVHDVDSHTLLGQRLPISVGSEKTTVFNTRLDDHTKPFPKNHPLDGTEIIPAAVLFNSFLSALETRSLSDTSLLVPVAISAPRNVQLVVEGNKVRLTSRLIPAEGEAEFNSAWLTHTTSNAATAETGAVDLGKLKLDVESIRSRTTEKLKPTFTIDYLASIAATEMGFPWAVTEHLASADNKEMLTYCDVDPSIPESGALPWNPSSWAPIFDAVTSIGSCLFHQEPRLRMPAHVGNVTIKEGMVPPKTCYIYVEEASNTPNNLTADVTVTDESGAAIAKFSSMRFSEIEGEALADKTMDKMVHQVAWKPTQLSEHQLPLNQVVFVCENDHPLLGGYKKQLQKKRINSTIVANADSLLSASVDLDTEGTVIVYLPGEVEYLNDVASFANSYCGELLNVFKVIASNDVKARVFTITDGAFEGVTPTALAHAPLIGLGRIIAAEQADFWGALIDIDGVEFPFQAIKYISDKDVIRIEDTVARTCRLRPLPKEMIHPSKNTSRLNPRPEGTYLISGGLGALGLEVASFLVSRGARRLVLLSRRSLPPRNEWSTADYSIQPTLQKIQILERAGATVHCLRLDISAADAATTLTSKLESLALPSVLGVVHAAGVTQNEYVLDVTSEGLKKVQAPKIAGTLALHQVFPPNSGLDFFILFSSCGQLFGFPGQASYASGNAFLDSMAEHRRALGDNTVSLQMTSWRGLGLAATDPETEEFIEAELEAKGLTSMSKDEAFRAWDHIGTYDISHGVVMRFLPIDPDAKPSMPILEEVVERRALASAAGGGDAAAAADASGEALPPPGPERQAYLTAKIAECVASVLQIPSGDDVDPKAALPDLGMDSVMTVSLRRQLQGKLKVKVPPTLVWGHPTVSHLVKWFGNEVGK
ncbi:MAG: hypothetical protein Q9217_002313 [Psora testacea]